MKFWTYKANFKMTTSKSLKLLRNKKSLTKDLIFAIIGGTRCENWGSGILDQQRL